MILVDTNVLIYAADNASPFHKKCSAWLRAQRERNDAWFTTWPILYEFLRIVSHRRVTPKPWCIDQASQFVDALLASPGPSVLVATSRHPAVARSVFTELPEIAGNILHDTHTAILMRGHGIARICNFHRFPFLQVVDPVRP